MTRAEFSRALSLLTAAVGRPMPEEQLAAWYALLGDLTPDELKRGLVETLRTHQFAGFPTVGTIRSNSGCVTHTAKGDPLLAWQAVRDAIRRVGAYDSPRFEDPVIHAVIRELGGWVAVCDTPSDEMQWLEKRFSAAYAAMASVRLPSDQTARLTGLSEIDNSRGGYRAEQVRVVEVRCLSVASKMGGPIALHLEGTEQAPARLPQSTLAVARLAQSMGIDERVGEGSTA